MILSKTLFCVCELTPFFLFAILYYLFEKRTTLDIFKSFQTQKFFFVDC